MLEHFNGTILLISHDRYLIDRLATQIWEIKDDRLEIFDGTYQQYLAAHGATVEAMSLVAARQRQTPSDNGGKGSREQKKKRNEHRIAQLEAQIASMEVALSRLGQDLQIAGQGGRGYDRLQDISRQYQTAQRQLDDLIAEWAALAGE